ncbi:MAG: hypothetical protein OEN02_03380 [Gammaproteobacteria bacterium]|nr:hypothetical protein [Gammaproteobacteria bacterium]
MYACQPRRKVVGKTASRTCRMLTIDPGEHEIASLTENTSKIIINAVTGRNHVIWQEVKMGILAARATAGGFRRSRTRPR